MDLKDIRNRIDEIDRQLVELIESRTNCTAEVAKYKKESGMAVFDSERENAVLEKIEILSSEKYKLSNKLAFSNIMDISKCLQYIDIIPDDNYFSNLVKTAKKFNKEENSKVICQGILGSYSHIAAKNIFPNSNIDFFDSFDDIFEEIKNGNADYGVLPIENSTAGSVSAVYDLIRENNIYITHSEILDVDHCLAASKNYGIDKIEAIYSHEQALSQCSNFLKEHNNISINMYPNTAMAAKFVSELDKPFAAICSKKCADIYGLNVLEDFIANEKKNSTKFIVISKDFKIVENADTISLALELENKENSLSRLLTYFSVTGIDLTRIESKIIPGEDFNVVFYLNFKGNVLDKKVQKLLVSLSDQLSYFNFLGNYN